MARKSKSGGAGIPEKYSSIARQRVVIENVRPNLEGGYPIKRVPGDTVFVQADLFADGHDEMRAALSYRHSSEKSWKTSNMSSPQEDVWEGSFKVEKPGEYEYFVHGWVDILASWRHGLERKVAAGQDVTVEMLSGAEAFREAADTQKGKERKQLQALADLFQDRSRINEAIKIALNPSTDELIHEVPTYVDQSRSEVLRVRVERRRAGFSAWYEFFPRSAAGTTGRHGTFADAEKNVLPLISWMGFDVIYLPPIHPVGVQFRKGPNNSTTSHLGDPGSTWAIGAAEGGHMAIHPELGTIDDFRRFVKAANSHEIEVAIDLAFQCSPDHPWVSEHPEWFKWRPDGTVQYAENPPKKYQDVLPMHFESDDWQSLWLALRDVVYYWMEQGVTIFRVDNPHTKPFHFWEWLLAEVYAKDPNILFLSEAFTRPRIMARLARIGFHHSYTYFTWTNTKGDFERYMNELVNSPMREYFRPNFWPNTPDILGWNLQFAEEPMFVIRYILAATLSGNYGIYGPVYELGVNDPVPGREEYSYSEKYELKAWDFETQTPFRKLISRVNRIRKDMPALQDTFNLTFNQTDSDQLLSYTKIDASGADIVVVVVNLNASATVSGWVRVPLWRIGLKDGDRMILQDLITNVEYTWDREWNYVELDPRRMPFHLFRLIKP